MPGRISLVVLAVVQGLAACGRTESPPIARTQPPALPPGATPVPAAADPLPQQITDDVKQLADRGAATARASGGAIAIRAWRYAGAPPLGPDRQWVAVDVDYGALDVDPDHAELADADGTEIAAIGDEQRLDADGNRVPLMDGAHANLRHYFLMFDLPASAKHVRLRSWGEPVSGVVAVAAQGPVFAAPSRQVLRHFADGDRHVFLVEDRNMDDEPSFVGDWFKDVDRKACSARGLVAVDRALAPALPPADPPATIAHAMYLVDFRCTQTPHVLGWGPNGTPLPDAEPLHLPDAALEALAGRAPETVVVEMPAAGRARVAVRRDGSMVAIAPGKALELRLLDPKTGAELARLPGPPNSALLALAFTPDGTRLVGVEDEGDVIVWDVARRAHVATRRLVPPPMLYSKLAMSPDGRTIAIDHPLDNSVGWDGQIELLATANLAPRATLRVLPDTEHAVESFAFSPDGKRLAVCSNDGGVRVYAVPGGGKLVSIRAPGPDAHAEVCAIAADGRILIGYDDGQLAIHDAGGRRVSSITPAPDGTIYTSGADGKLVHWTRDLLAPRPIVHLRHPIFDVLVAGALVVATDVDEVAIARTDGHALAYARGTDWIETPAIGDGVVASIDTLLGAGIARVRIWHAPAAAATRAP